MKKNLLPILLVAGAAIAFIAFRRRVIVEAGPTETITKAEFESAPRQTAAQTIKTGAQLISDLFKKKAGAKAQRVAVRRSVKSKTATRQQAQAVTKSLSRGIRFSGFDDNVLV